MKQKNLFKDTYCVPETSILPIQLDGPLAASVNAGQTEDVTYENWTI